MTMERQGAEVKEGRDRLASFSHDLKNPLTAIKLFADILLDEAGEAPRQRRAYLANISMEAERAGRMIDNLADIQALDNATLEWCDEACDLVELVAQCVNVFEPLCLAKGIAFNCRMELRQAAVVLDKRRFKRLLSGLLGNALRYTERGAISLELAEAAGHFALRVEDSGSGIAEETVMRLCQGGRPQLRGEIGLSFACCLLDHCGGTVSAERLGGGGSLFQVMLPSGDVQGR